MTDECCTTVTLDKLKKREELSGAFLPKIMLSPSTELHSCSSPLCSNLRVSQPVNDATRVFASDSKTSSLTTFAHHPADAPPPHPTPPPVRARCLMCSFGRASCVAARRRQERNTAAALSVTQHAAGPLQRKPVIYSPLHIRSGREHQRTQLRWEPCLTGGACLPLALSHILGLGIS